MKFWKWYLKGVLQISRVIIAPWTEYMWGIILGMIGGMFFGISLTLGQEPSPWILLAVPVGITIAFHGYWRAAVNKE